MHCRRRILYINNVVVRGFKREYQAPVRILGLTRNRKFVRDWLIWITGVEGFLNESLSQELISAAMVTAARMLLSAK